jgi:hypothetical protein
MEVLMHTKRVVALVAVVLGVCAVAAATVGADAVGTFSNPKRLDIITKATAINNYVDVGPAGASPGDLYVFTDDVFYASDPSTKIGTADGRCVMVDPAKTRFGCTIITSLDKGGDIITDGKTILVPGTTSTGAVTGGTGDFRNARGEAALNLGPPDGPHQATFKLIVYP